MAEAALLAETDELQGWLSGPFTISLFSLIGFNNCHEYIFLA